MLDIKNYENEYAVTSCGKVWSYKSKKFLTASETKNGYLQVSLLLGKIDEICSDIIIAKVLIFENHKSISSG